MNRYFSGLAHSRIFATIVSLFSVLFFVSNAFYIAEASAKESKKKGSGKKEAVMGEFTYSVDGKDYQGFVASDVPQGKKAPGVLIVHEWWGHNEYPEDRAKQVAKEGYVGFALDMFGKGKVATHPKDAQSFAMESMSNPEQAKKIFEEALRILKDREDVDADKIAVIGYCYGGAVALTMASMGVDMDLVASFHGALSKDFEMPKRDKNPKILIFNGEDDPMVGEEQKKAVQGALGKAGVDYDFIDYKGAKHAFTNPGATEKGKKFEMPLEYNQKADEDSWKRFLTALKEL